MNDIEARLMDMEIGSLFGLWFQSSLIGIIAWALSICIFIITYGRMIEIYMITSVAPIPMATMVNREWGQMGQNYLRSLFALGFQAFLIMVCVGIYAVLVQNISVDSDVSTALWTCIGYPVQRPMESAHDQLHQQLAEANEDDNAAVSAVLQGDRLSTSALQMGEHAYHAHKLRPYRQAQNAERALDEANIVFQDVVDSDKHGMCYGNICSLFASASANALELGVKVRTLHLDGRVSANNEGCL